MKTNKEGSILEAEISFDVKVKIPHDKLYTWARLFDIDPRDKQMLHNHLADQIVKQGLSSCFDYLEARRISKEIEELFC